MLCQKMCKSLNNYERAGMASLAVSVYQDLSVFFKKNLRIRKKPISLHAQLSCYLPNCLDDLPDKYSPPRE